MNPLPPIPTPFSQYWREFRIRVVPIVVFVVLIGAVIVLWPHAALLAGASGVGEGLRAQVTTPQMGVVERLLVEPYQLVEAGTPIAIVRPQDPRAQLDVLRTELQLAQMRFQPSVAEGNAMSFERIRVEFLRTRSEIAMAKVNLARAENEVRRNKPLFEEKLVSEDIYDLSLKTRDLYKAEIAEKEKAANEIEQRLTELRGLGVPQAAATNDAVLLQIARLEAMQQSATDKLSPITLTAPISGIVGTVYRQGGENVLAGEALLTINALWSDRIVGYLRQPYYVNPEKGLKVQITLRDRWRKSYESQISQVGAHIEIITNSLAIVKQGVLVDAGLPFVVDLPPTLKIRPGEVVDLRIEPRRGTGASVEAAKSVRNSN